MISITSEMQLGGPPSEFLWPVPGISRLSEFWRSRWTSNLAIAADFTFSLFLAFLFVLSVENAAMIHYECRQLQLLTALSPGASLVSAEAAHRTSASQTR